MRSFFGRLPLTFKFFIAILLTISLGQIFVMVYIWQYETKILFKKENHDLLKDLESHADKLLFALQTKQKETTFLSTLEIMDDLIANDIDRRVSGLLKRKADDLGEGIVLLAVKNHTVVAASDDDFVDRNFTKPKAKYDSDTLYFDAPIGSSFDPKVQLGEIIMRYPLQNLANLQTSQSQKHLWLTPPTPIALFNKVTADPKEFFIVKKPLWDILSGWQISLAYQKSKALEMIDHIQNMLLATFLASLAVLMGVVWLISQNMLKGVGRLSKTTEAILQTKDYTRQVAVESTDEIGQLSASFNTLIQKTHTLLTQLDFERKTYYENLIELIAFFNAITQTSDFESTITLAKEKLLHFTQASHVTFETHAEENFDQTLGITVTDFRKKIREKLGFFVIHESKNDHIDERFFKAITDMIGLQLERISLLDTTKEALEAKQLFLSTISHELRTPLGSILSLTQHLMITESLSEEEVDILANIEASATHLLALINNILHISKLESNRLPVHPQKVDLPKLLEEILEMIAPLAEEKGLEIVRHVDLTSAFLNTDPQLIKQVVINLLSNAIKFTDHGAITIDLKQTSDDRFLLSVIDTGMGIKPQLLGHIFEAFYQSSVDLKHLGNSSGLGLALSKKIANLLGGDLKILSEGEGKGCVVEFWFRSL